MQYANKENEIGIESKSAEIVEQLEELSLPENTRMETCSSYNL